MPIIDIHHVAIKTADLERTVDFYNNVLGTHSVERPPLSFPGAWLALGATMFHIYAGAPARNEAGIIETGGAAVDHIAIQAREFDAMKEIAKSHGLEYRQNSMPSFNIWQLFLRDPNNIMIELNFAIDQEPPGAKGPDGEHPYVAGKW